MTDLEQAAWISVTDRLPTEGQRVIYYFEIVGIHIGKYKKGEDGTNIFWGPSGYLGDDVTHWMPLPPTPTGGDK